MSALLCMPHQKHYAIAEAFHEAVSDAIALSVSTPKHLQTLGLVQKSVDDTAHDINFLFSLALDKVCTSNVTISFPNITASPSTEKKIASIYVSGCFPSICIGYGCVALGYLQQKYRRRSIQLPLVAPKV